VVAAIIKQQTIESNAYCSVEKEREDVIVRVLAFFACFCRMMIRMDLATISLLLLFVLLVVAIVSRKDMSALRMVFFWESVLSNGVSDH